MYPWFASTRQIAATLTLLGPTPMPAPAAATRARTYNSGPLAGTDAALHIPQEFSEGNSTLPMTSTMSEVFLHMLEPLLVAQHRCLACVGKMFLHDSPLKYNVFQIGLGMARLRRVHDICPSKRYMSIVKGRIASNMQYNFEPVLWGLCGTNCRSLPARFPLWGTIVSSPVTVVQGFHELLHCLLHARSNPATSPFRIRFKVYHSDLGMRTLRRGTATTPFGLHTQ